MVRTCDTRCAEEKCDQQYRNQSGVGANGMVKWRICSLPMELTSGSEFVTDFEISEAET